MRVNTWHGWRANGAMFGSVLHPYVTINPNISSIGHSSSYSCTESNLLVAAKDRKKNHLGCLTNRNGNGFQPTNLLGDWRYDGGISARMMMMMMMMMMRMRIWAC